MSDEQIGISAYPLYWPEGWKRSRHQENSKFKSGFGAARDEMLRENRTDCAENTPGRNLS